MIEPPPLNTRFPVGMVVGPWMRWLRSIGEAVKSLQAQGTAAVSVAWDAITGKPDTFPSDPHTHAQYLTEEKDPTVPAHVKGISASQIADWDAPETDPTVPAHVKAITQEQIDNWNALQDIPGPDLEMVEEGVLVVKQLTGVGSKLLRVQTDFEWVGWGIGFTTGGRGIAAGYAWFGSPGSQVRKRVWCANDAYGMLYWTTDNWTSTTQDDSAQTITSPAAPPCLAYIAIDGQMSWVLTSNVGGVWWFAEDIQANYNTDGTLKASAWAAGATAPHLIADIGQGPLASCVVGNHSNITRTTDWVTWTVVYTGSSVIGGIDTDGEGNWIAVERDTGVVIASYDDGLTWANPAISTRASEDVPYTSDASVIPTGAVVYANGVWLLTGAASYAYSVDGINWTIQESALGSFYGIGFDGIRLYATNPDRTGWTEDPPVIYQLLASSIPAHRHLVAEKGLTIGGDGWIPDLPGADALGTGPTGKIVRRDVTISESAPVGGPGPTDWIWFVVEPL